MSYRWLAIVAILGFPLAALAGGGEIRACVHKNTGTVRVITGSATCNPNNESPLTWNAGGSGGFRVLDSKEALVGRLLESDHVFVFVDGHWLAPTVTKSGFAETGLFQLYESTDCTGQAYVEYSDRIPEWGGSSLGGGGTLTIYYAAPPIVPRTIQSSRAVFSSGPAQPCLEPLNFVGIPVGIPQPATLTASPPFRLVE
jgi:hypothetical protein